MRLHWIGHASFLLEADGCRVLVDPFLGGPDPREVFDFARRRRVHSDLLPGHDVLVVTSRRPGRFDVASLAALPRDVEVLVGDDPSLAECLTKLGYPRLSRCRPFEERTVGSTRLSITPSSSHDEGGVVVADGSGVLWSIADGGVDASVVDQVRARGLDRRPARGLAPASAGRCARLTRGPASRYREHLATVARIQPRSLVPWGDVLGLGGVRPLTPVLEVPVSRQRFCLDSTALLARLGAKVFSLDPGDVLEVEPGPAAGEGVVAEHGGVLRVSTGGCPFVDRADEQAPAPAGPPAPPSGAEHPLLAIVTREVEEVLAASFRRAAGIGCSPRMGARRSSISSRSFLAPSGANGPSTSTRWKTAWQPSPSGAGRTREPAS